MAPRRRRKLPKIATDTNQPGNHYRDHVGSLSALIDLVRTSPADSAAASRFLNTEYSWDLSIGWDGALELMRTGWIEKARELEQSALRFASDIRTERYDLRPVLDVSGDDCNVAEFLAGEPECFVRHEAVRTKGGKQRNHNVELYVACFASCSVSQDHIQNRGTYAYLLARSLMLAGINVGITLYLSVTQNNHTALYTARMKEPDQYIDLPTLAFWLVHPAAYRRAGFAWCETRPVQERDDLGFRPFCSYGLAGILPDDISRTGIDIPPITSHNQDEYCTPDQAGDKVKSQLRAQGIDVD